MPNKKINTSAIIDTATYRMKDEMLNDITKMPVGSFIKTADNDSWSGYFRNNILQIVTWNGTRALVCLTTGVIGNMPTKPMTGQYIAVDVDIKFNPSYFEDQV